MLDSEVKVTEKQSSSSIPTHTETHEGEVPTDLPTEVVLAILFTQAKALESRALAQILTGRTPKGEVVTYIKLSGVTVDKEKGFVLAVKESVGNETRTEKQSVGTRS